MIPVLSALTMFFVMFEVNRTDTESIDIFSTEISWASMLIRNFIWSLRFFSVSQSGLLFMSV